MVKLPSVQAEDVGEPVSAIVEIVTGPVADRIASPR
jgi:type IV secretory pathway VirB2 component (pilin)